MSPDPPSTPAETAESTAPATPAPGTRAGEAGGSDPGVVLIRTLVVVVATGLLLTTVVNGSVGAGADVAFGEGGPGVYGDAPEAVALLQASAEAGRQLPYTGTFTTRVYGGGVSGWFTERSSTDSAVARVTNVPGQGVDVQAEQGRDSAAFVSATEDGPGYLEDGAVQVLNRGFDLVMANDDEVAGRSAAVVEARRLGGELAGRIWIDRETDLLLRREVYDASGALVRSSEFHDVQVDPMRSAFATLATALPESEGEPVAEDDYDALANEGWTCCPPDLSGVLELQDVRRVDGGDPALQLVYSDGLTTASVFEQAGQLEPANLEGFQPRRYGENTVYVREGLVTYAAWESDGIVYTVACDTPHGLAVTVAGFPHRPAAGDDADGEWQGRVERGMSRMMSWVNPFD